MSKYLRQCAINTMRKEAIGDIKHAEKITDGFFIPFAKYNNSWGKVNGIINTMGKRVDDRYDPKTYGKQWYADKSKTQGISIIFKPTNALITAGKIKLKELDAEKARRDAQSRIDGESFSKREATDPNLNKTYNQVLQYKKDEMSFIQKELASAQNKFNTDSSKASEKEVNRLSDLLEELQNDIKALNNKDEEILNKVIRNDIAAINAALESDSVQDLHTVKNSIEFYKAFYPLFKHDPEIQILLSDMFADGKNEKGDIVLSDYTKKLTEKVQKILATDPNVKNTLNYLNTSEEAPVLRLRETLKKNGIIEEVDDEIQIKDLLYRNKDIGTLEKLFTTVTDGFDNIIPQVIMNSFNNEQNKELNHVINMLDTLEKLKKENPNVDVNEFFDKDKRLVNIYTDKYSEALSDRFNLIDKFWNDSHTNAIKYDAYKNIVIWHQMNTDVIDFTKIADVKTVFESRYKDYFSATDKEMEDYEQSIIDRIGLLEWGKMKQKILNQLHRYEEMRTEYTDPSDVRNYPKVVRNNVWEFTKNYFGKGDKEMGFIEENGVRQLFNFKSREGGISLHYIPKQDTKNTPENLKKGFYSEDFKKIANDDKKYQMWQAYRNMLIYIDHAYSDKNYESLYAPKIPKQAADKVGEAFRDFKVKGQQFYAEKTLDSLQELGNSSLQGVGVLRKALVDNWRQLYYSKLPEEQKKEARTITSNNLDTSGADFMRNVRAVKAANPKMSQEEVERIAKEQLAPTYSQDIDKSIQANLLSASLHVARMRTEPKAAALMETYKNITAGKEGEGGRVRRRAIEKNQHYVDKVLYNDANELTKGEFWGAPWGKGLYKMGKLFEDTLLSDKVKLVRNMSKGVKGSGKLFSDQEAIIIKNIEEAINKDREEKDKIDFLDLMYDEKNNIKEIEDIVKNSGLDISISSVVEGMLRASIIRYLGLNPASAAMNRVEGLMTNDFEDTRGEYWTRGNMRVARNMMTFANIAHATQWVNKGYDTAGGNVKQMKIFRALLERIGGLQDRKDELQKSSEANTPEGFISNAVFDWAVTKPEFKNQGEIMLAIMMDKKVVDDNGFEHSFIDKETGMFTALDIDSTGQLKIKDGFKDNFSFDDTDMLPENKGLLPQIAYQSQLSIAAIHGNYLSTDAMMAKKGLGFKSLMTFKTWLPANVIRRWGAFNKNGNIDINPATGKLKRDGMYVESFRGSPGTIFTKFGVDNALAYGFLPSSVWSIAGLAGISAFSAYMVVKQLKDVTRDKKDFAEHAKILGLFIVDTLKNTAGYGAAVASFVPKSGWVVDKLDKVNPFKDNKTLTPEEIMSMKAVAKELGYKLAILGYKMLISSLLWDEDDPAGSSKRRFHHFLQNLLWKNMQALDLYSSPTAIWDTMTETTLLRDAMSVVDAMHLIIGDFDTGIQGVRALTPIPSDVLAVDKRGFHLARNPFLENTYLEESLFANPDFKYKWYREGIKNIKSGGKRGLEKEWKEVREKIATKADRAFEDDFSKPEIKEIKRLLKNVVFTERPDNMPLEIFEEFIESQDPDKELTEMGRQYIVREMGKIIVKNEIESKTKPPSEKESKKILEEVQEKLQKLDKILIDEFN